MKAVLVSHRGDAGTLKEVPNPTLAPRELLVRVTAAGVNPVDWKIRDGGAHPLPFVLGQDFAGTVLDAGGSVRRYRLKDRVFGIAREHGAYAEYTVVPEDDRTQPIAKIPDDVGDADAAALPTAGLTALAALEVLRVEKGTMLLVVGAVGGVGGYAVQLAHYRGAHVIGIARGVNEALAKSLGVEEFIPYDRGDDPIENVGNAHHNGIDAVLDLVSGPGEIKRMADVLRGGGRIVSPIGSCDIDWFAQRKLVAENLVMAKTPQSSHEGLCTLIELVAHGNLRVTIARERPLSDAPRALEESKKGTIDGKVVLTIG